MRQAIARSTNERDVLTRDHMDAHAREHFREALPVSERCGKLAAPEQPHDARRNATTDEYAAGREHRESKIAGLRTDPRSRSLGPSHLGTVTLRRDAFFDPTGGASSMPPLRCSPGPPRRDRLRAVLISATCVNACGKLPS